MEYVRLGQTGLIVSRLGLGTMTFGWQAGVAEVELMTAVALDHGITFFDTANVYGGEAGNSETMLGAALRARRDDVVIATKLGRPVRTGPHGGGASRIHIRWSVQQSLRRLGTTHIDMLSIHEFDPVTPLEESLRALDDLVRAGDVRYIGLSNFAAYQAAMACGIADRFGLSRPACLQFRYNLVAREAEVEMLPAVRALGIGGIAYNPLAGGLLTSVPPDERPATARLATNKRYQALYLNERSLAFRGRLESLCIKLEQPLETVALCWLLARTGIDACLIGASSGMQLQALLAQPITPLSPECRRQVEAL